MLSHKVISRQNVGDVVHYYEDGVDDYYSKEGDGSVWQGRGAEALGLRGKVDTQRFHELLRGEVGTEQRSSRLATRRDSHNRVAIDLTFSAPKSVSLQALVAGDARIVRAHDRAVARALEVAEARAQARQKVDGKSRVEQTRNLIVAKFRHETSRAQDPQLHTHAIVMNLTRRNDGSWRALRNDEIVKSTKYLGSVYRAELAKELQELGFEIRHGRDGLFELAHIGREQLARFSQRGEEIERELAARGVDRESATSAQKQVAALSTRQRKSPVEREAIREEWRARARAYGLDLEPQAAGGPTELQPRPVSEGRQLPDAVVRPASGETTPAAAAGARRGVRYAINHLTERQAVVAESDLLKTALNHVVGAAAPRDVTREIDQLVRAGYLIREAPVYRPADAVETRPAFTRDHWVRHLTQVGLDREAARARVDDAIRSGGLVPAEVRYTTQTALERERRILAAERHGRGSVALLLPAAAVHEHLSRVSLTAGQRNAVVAITTTENRVIGIQGLAGTGKSHMLREAKELVASTDHQVVALAPYATQVRALRELGVEARTVASFLAAKEKHIDHRTVLVVDEAGTVPTRQMEQILRLAEERGARAVLLGDTQQTKAIEAGRPFDQLLEHGMQTVTMSEIQRQQNKALREAVELAAGGRPAASLARIAEVREVQDDHERRRAIALDFAQLGEHDRNRTIIVSGTNESRREINEAVRQNLGLAGSGRTYATLSRRDTTQAERAFSKNYSVGELIQPERDYPRLGLKRGSLYEVTETGPGNRLTVRDEHGATLTFSPKHARKLSVYAREAAELAPGDRVRITRNDAERDLANGDRYRIIKTTPEAVYLTDERRVVALPADRPLHLDHAYATTVHSAQGTTADRVLYDACTRSRTTADDVYYVAISRARFEATIYTDNRERLPGAIARANTKHAALDVARSKQAQREPDRALAG